MRNGKIKKNPIRFALQERDSILEMSRSPWLEKFFKSRWLWDLTKFDPILHYFLVHVMTQIQNM